MLWVFLEKYLTTLVMDPADIYLFKVNNGNTSTMCEICSKITIKATERPSSVFC